MTICNSAHMPGEGCIGGLECCAMLGFSKVITFAAASWQLLGQVDYEFAEQRQSSIASKESKE